MRELLGWLALAISLSGLALATRGDQRGWALGLASGGLWLLFAFANHQPVYMVTSGLYMVIDTYGWSKRRTTRIDKDTACRLLTDGRFSLFNEH